MSENTNQTTALYVILHNPNLLRKLLKAWKKTGVPGVTIEASTGNVPDPNHSAAACPNDGRDRFYDTGACSLRRG